MLLDWITIWKISCRIECEKRKKKQYKRIRNDRKKSKKKKIKKMWLEERIRNSGDSIARFSVRTLYHWNRHMYTHKSILSLFSWRRDELEKNNENTFLSSRLPFESLWSFANARTFVQIKHTQFLPSPSPSPSFSVSVHLLLVCLLPLSVFLPSFYFVNLQYIFVCIWTTKFLPLSLEYRLFLGNEIFLCHHPNAK